MKKILCLTLMLAGCTTYHQTVSSYNKIDMNTKTVAMKNAHLGDIHQDLKQALLNSGFEVYNDYSSGHQARYKLIDNINKDDNIRCGLWEDGYTYEITLTDTIKKQEVFSIEGEGCQRHLLEDFMPLINNQYGEKKDKTAEVEDNDTMRAPNLKSDGVTWWGN